MESKVAPDDPDVLFHFKYKDWIILFSLNPGGSQNVHVLDGEQLTESKFFEQFRDYYVAPRYAANSESENRKNCTGGKNIQLYQNTYLTYMTKSNKLIMYNLAGLYQSKFEPANGTLKDFLIEYELGNVRPQAFTFENKTFKKDRIIVLLENGIILKFYLGDKIPHRKNTLPDSLRKGTLPTEVIHADSTTIVAVNELSSLTNVFISLDKKLEVTHRLTVPNQGSGSSPSLARPPAQVHLPPEEEAHPRDQLLRVGDHPREERSPAGGLGKLIHDDPQ